MEDKYANELLRKIEELEIGLKFYINKSQKQENELKALREMYDNRVEEYIKLKTGKIEKMPVKEGE